VKPYPRSTRWHQGKSSGPGCVRPARPAGKPQPSRDAQRIVDEDEVGGALVLQQRHAACHDPREFLRGNID